MISGAMNFVSEEPAFPAPKMPMAVPCRSLLNHAEVYAMPTANEPPATPMNSPSSRYCQYSVA